MLRTAESRLIAGSVPISQLLLAGGRLRAPSAFLASPPRPIHSSGRSPSSSDRASAVLGESKPGNHRSPSSQHANTFAASSPQQRQWNNSTPPPLPGRGAGLYNLPYKNQFGPPQAGPSIKASGGGDATKPAFGQRAHTLKPYTPSSGQGPPASQGKDSKLQALLADITGIDPAPAPPKKGFPSTRAQPRQGGYGAPQSQFEDPPPVLQRPPYRPPPQGQAPSGRPPPLQGPQFGAPPPVQSQLERQPQGQQQFGGPPPVQQQYPPPGPHQYGGQRYGAPPTPGQQGMHPPRAQQGDQRVTSPPSTYTVRPEQPQLGGPPPRYNASQTPYGALPQQQQPQFHAPPPTHPPPYGARPSQGQTLIPSGAMAQSAARPSHPFAVQPPQGQPAAPPPVNAQQYGARPASTPHQFVVQQPAQGQSGLQPQVAQPFGARPAPMPHQFAVQQPVQGQPGIPSQGVQRFGAGPAPVPHPFAVQQPPQGQASAPSPVPHPFAVQQPPQGQYSAPPPQPVQGPPGVPSQGAQRFGARPAPVPHPFGVQQPPQGQASAPSPVPHPFAVQQPPQGQYSAPPPQPIQGPPGVPSQGAQRFGARPAPVPHPFGVQQPPQGQASAPSPVSHQSAVQQPPQGQTGPPPPVTGQYGTRPASSAPFNPQYPPQVPYGTRPAPSSSPFAVQPPSQTETLNSRVPWQQAAETPQHGTRPASSPPFDPQYPPQAPYSTRPAPFPSPFAVQQPSQAETPNSRVPWRQAPEAPAPLQGQFSAPPSVAAQYGARTASSPSPFAVQQPAQTEAPKVRFPWQQAAETFDPLQGESSVPPSVAAQYGARPASSPSPFAVQQPAQAEAPKVRFPWRQPAAETPQGGAPSISRYDPTPSYGSSQQGSQQPYGTGQVQRQWQQGEGQQGYNSPRYGQNYRDREQPRYQRRDDDSGYHRRDDSSFKRSDDSRYPYRQQEQHQQEPDLTQSLREKQQATITPVDPEPFDTRKKKAALIKDKDKRSATFTTTESFLLDDDPVALAQREAKLAKKKAKREQPTPILLPQFISVSLLANQLKVPLDKFLEKLGELGFVEIGYNHVLSAEDAGLIAMEYNYEPIVDTSKEKDLLPLPWPPSAEEKELLPPRPPVVTIMGHVDHGKTTLLDYLRKSSVASSEHGGITQHIGAFSVHLSSGRLATFLDTPGHAAFLSMRERGANVTDIVILVVAADDSVMPQTVEAIKHAKAAGVPMIVAVNKCDMESANIENVKSDLARHDVEIEDMGGDTQVIPVSGKTGLGMDDLEEATMALAEVLDMRAEVDGPAEGWILEATTKKRGRVATVLVRRGTLRQGDIIVAGHTWARVRNLLNEAGAEVAQAGPGTPVEVDGWRDQPDAGDLVIQAPSEEKAKSVVEFRLVKAERLRQATDMEAINSTRKLLRDQNEAEKLASSNPTAAAAEVAVGVAEVDSAKEEEGGSKLLEIPFLVKADVSGSVEAVNNALASLGNNEIQTKLIRSAVGPVSEFDIDLASATNATIITFNLALPPHLLAYSRHKNPPVTIHSHTIIYHLATSVKSILESHLPPSITIKVTGEAEILQIFQFKVKKKVVPFAGCRVKLGTVNKGSKVKVRRGGEVVWTGMLASLKNGKDDVLDVKDGGECGVGFDGWEGFKAGDVLQCFYEVVEKRELPMAF